MQTFRSPTRAAPQSVPACVQQRIPCARRAHNVTMDPEDEPLPDVSPADALAIDNRVAQLASSASLLEGRALSLKPIVPLGAREGPVPAPPSVMRRKLVGRRNPSRLAPLEARMMLVTYDSSYKQRMLNEMTQRMQSPIRAVRLQQQ